MYIRKEVIRNCRHNRVCPSSKVASSLRKDRNGGNGSSSMPVCVWYRRMTHSCTCGPASTVGHRPLRHRQQGVKPACAEVAASRWPEAADNFL